MAWIGVSARYPQYRSRADRTLTIDVRINECLKRSLAGKALPPDDDRLRAIKAYFAFLSDGTAQTTRGGIDSVHATVIDRVAGKTVFAAKCARCHGSNGEGGIHDVSGVDAPPVWGTRSFTIGAGMGRYLTAAGFVWRNMPFDAPGSLSEQEALDVAAYVDGHSRPDFAGKENDWPRKNAPKDVPYKTAR
jgi:thiosulfate dehydrogenase